MPAPALTPIASDSKASGLKRIVTSIMMEASEKCEEIDVKCDEEYQVLRRKEISEQGEIIERADKKRREQVLRNDRVCFTKLINNSRLAQLKAKNDIYNEILKTVKYRVSTDTSNRYKQLLENSLIQAMYMLMEPEVYITCRKKDQNLVSSTFPSAANIYEKNTKLRVTLGFSNKSLPNNSSSGGMLVSTKNETISVNCSLESRVDYVCHLAMPMIVEMLFKGHTNIKGTPKLALQKAISPSADPKRVHMDEQSKNQPRKRDQSESPETSVLLEERLGIGSSTINILSPPEATASKRMPEDHPTPEKQNGSPHSVEERKVSTEMRPPAKTSSSGSQGPDPDSANKPSTSITRSSSPNNERGSSSKDPQPDTDPNRKSSTKSPSPNGQGPSKKSESGHDSQDSKSGQKNSG